MERELILSLYVYAFFCTIICIFNIVIPSSNGIPYTLRRAYKMLLVFVALGVISFATICRNIPMDRWLDLTAYYIIIIGVILNTYLIYITLYVKGKFKIKVVNSHRYLRYTLLHETRVVTYDIKKITRKDGYDIVNITYHIYDLHKGKRVYITSDERAVIVPLDFGEIEQYIEMDIEKDFKVLINYGLRGNHYETIR